MLTVFAIGLSLTILQSGLAADPQQPTLPRYSFTVEIEGRSLGSFREVSGLGVTTEVIEYREGGDRTTIYLPGNAKYTPVKLSRAFTGDLALWDWYTTSAQGGHITRVTGTITMFDHAGQAVAKWNFVRGWPMKYKGPKLNAGSNDIPLETIEIVHEGLKVTRPDDTR